MSSKTSSSRDQFLDVIKGGLIILVVVGHVIQANYANFDNIFLFKLIYSFHMPLFITVSGYIAFVSLKDRNYLNQLWKKFLVLVIPFLSWYYIFGFIINQGYKTYDLLTYTKNIIKSPDYGLWFLWTLFLCYLILFLLKLFRQKFQLQNNRYEYLLIFISIIVTNAIYFNPAPGILGLGFLKAYLPCFFVGYLVAKHIQVFKLYFSKILTLSILSSPILFYFWSRVDEPVFAKFLFPYFHNNTYVLLSLYRYLTALTISIIFIGILRKIENQRALNLISYLGKKTMEIYVIQFPLLSILSFGLYVQGNIDLLQVVLIFISTMLIIITSILVANYFLRLNKLLSFLFL